MVRLVQVTVPHARAEAIHDELKGNQHVHNMSRCCVCTSKYAFISIPLSTFHLPPSTFHLPPSTFHLPPSTFHLPPSTFHLPPSTFHLPPSLPNLSLSPSFVVSSHLSLGIFPGEDVTMFVFRSREKYTGIVVNRLDQLRVGIDFGTIDIVQLQMTKPRLQSSRVPKPVSDRYRIDDRMTIEEIYEIVDSQTHLTFDYCALTVCAAIIAGVGLLTDSSVLVVASMLVSPLMGPILGLTFGTTIGDRVMIWKGIRNEIIGVLATWGVGCLCGLVVIPFSEIADWTTFEMSSRGTYSSMIGGVAVAIPSGAGVALSVTSDTIPALVGVAISASLLPPIANSGIAFVFGMVQWLGDHPIGEHSHFKISWVSMVLFCINWVLIYAFALVFFRLKRIRASSISHDPPDDELQRFIPARHPVHLADDRREEDVLDCPTPKDSDVRFSRYANEENSDDDSTDDAYFPSGTSVEQRKKGYTNRLDMDAARPLLQ
jgi:uncharacterized hydrophobic protein (TIGR00271 family)